MTPGRFARCTLLAVSGVSIATIIASSAAFVGGYRIVRTDSVPVGLWRLDRRAQPRAGDVAWICPSLRGLVAEGHRAGYIPDGDCPGGLSPLAKPVAAVAGDTIEIDRSGVRVNGRLLPRSRRFARDGEGRTIASVPAGRYTVGAGEVWFVSSYNPASYDSRYFGPLRVGDVRGQIRPVWVRG